ncbi:hypothetical protein HDE_00978 [Halotydeus destructor]|nr:hypothetical protein HDE_00978 [Halotydeus destructor]
MIGMVQRGEVDYSSAVTRSDCLNSESLGVMATFSEAGARIVSPTLNYSANKDPANGYNGESDKFEPFLDTFDLVDNYSYVGLWAAILAVVIVMTFAKGLRESKLLSRKSPQHLIEALFGVFELMVSQGKFNQSTTVVKSIWLLLTVALFIAISGAFLNLMQTEKVACRKADQIETMEDIVGNKFIGVEPTMVMNSFSYALDKIVKNGTKEGKLFRKLHERQDNLISATSQKDNIILVMYQAIDNKDRYALFEEVMYRRLRPILCHSQPDYTMAGHLSRETVLDGILVLPYRKTLDPRLKIYVEYRMKNFFELGLAGHDFLYIFKAIAQVTQQWATGKPKTAQCLMGLPDEADVPEMQFELGHSVLFLKFVAAMLALSVVVNIVELSIHQITN